MDIRTAVTVLILTIPFFCPHNLGGGGCGAKGLRVHRQKSPVGHGGVCAFYRFCGVSDFWVSEGHEEILKPTETH